MCGLVVGCVRLHQTQLSCVMFGTEAESSNNFGSGWLTFEKSYSCLDGKSDLKFSPNRNIP